MNLTRWICPLKSRAFPREFPRRLSTPVAAIKPDESSKTQVQEKYDFEDLKVLERVERRKAQIEPFMKNAYLSTFNKDLLAFPEILNKEEAADVENRVKTIESILNSREITDSEKDIAIKQSGIFGAPLKLTQGGLAMLTTERLRYLEALSAKPDLANKISDHWVGTGALKAGLPKEKLDEIIPHLLNGDHPVCLCLNERTASIDVQNDFRMTAQLKSGNQWYVDGEKMCTERDSYKLVLAVIEQQRLKVMLVCPDAAGVSYDDIYATFIDTPAINLDQVTDTKLNISHSRLDNCVLSYSILKRLVKKVERYVRGKFISGTPLADLPLLRTKVAEAMLAVYTAESMAYFTAGLIDGYEEPDAEIEIAMCRSYMSERAVDSAVRLLTIPGLESLKEEWTTPLEQLRALQFAHDTPDSLNVFIGLMALEYVGKNIHKEIKQMRNPLFHPGFIIKRLIADRHQAADQPKMNLYLEENLHPSLKAHAQKLEYSVLRLKYACEQVLGRYGSEVYLEHNDLRRIALAGVEVLAMTSVLARASRAYCIGLRNAEMEMRLAATSAECSRSRVQQLVLDCENGEYMNMDNFAKDVGRKILDGGTGNLVEKPIERVWW